MNIANRRAAVAVTLRVLVALEAGIFLIAALLHLGVPLPVGFAEPAIRDAAIVEGILTLFLAGAAYGLWTHRRWAWVAALVAHGVASAGILLGMFALAAGLGPTSDANYLYHRVMLAVALAVLLLLLTPLGRAALGRSAAGGN